MNFWLGFASGFALTMALVWAVVWQLNTDEIIGDLQTALDNAQDKIKRLTERVEALQTIAAELNAQNVGLKQQITRLESGRTQTVYPWKAE